MAKKNCRFTPFLVLVWIYFGCLPAGLAARNTADAHESELSLINITAGSRDCHFIVAQNDRNGEAANESDPKRGGESAPPGEDKKQPQKQKKQADPLEPFEPTEKVKADQAVDFPYDI